MMKSHSINLHLGTETIIMVSVYYYSKVKSKDAVYRLLCDR